MLKIKYIYLYGILNFIFVKQKLYQRFSRDGGRFLLPSAKEKIKIQTIDKDFCGLYVQ